MCATPKRQSPGAQPASELAPHDYEVLAEFRYLLMLAGLSAAHRQELRRVAPLLKVLLGRLEPVRVRQ